MQSTSTRGGRGGGTGYRPGLSSGKHTDFEEQDEQRSGRVTFRERDEPDSKRAKHEFAGVVHCAMAADAHIDWSTPTHVDKSLTAMIDGGCSSHLHPDASALINLRSCDKVITFGDKSTTRDKQVGDWPVKIKDEHGTWHTQLFKSVLVCPRIQGPMLSEKRIRNWNHDVILSDSKAIVLNARNPSFPRIVIPCEESPTTGLAFLRVWPETAFSTEHCGDAALTFD